MIAVYDTKRSEAAQMKQELEEGKQRILDEKIEVLAEKIVIAKQIKEQKQLSKA